ncbi:MAG: thioredoxin-dependent thiol peroxidase [Methanocella sp. PtaU1.Bin125]|nr:MAG: thioredoxin-dependent thiol peroxidase [Methanocella sp. PtaU1.Bin125]
MYERAYVAVDSIMPDFTLEDETGRGLSLKSFRKGKKYVVLAFVRAVDDRYTREQLDYLRNDYERFRHFGGDILVVSTGDVDFNSDMVTKLSLPFHMLSDRDCHVIKMLGLYNQYEKLVGPAIYLLNRAGTVLFLYRGAEPSDIAVNEEIIMAMQGDTQSGPDWPMRR